MFEAKEHNPEGAEQGPEPGLWTRSHCSFCQQEFKKKTKPKVTKQVANILQNTLQVTKNMFPILFELHGNLMRLLSLLLVITFGNEDTGTQEVHILANWQASRANPLNPDAGFCLKTTPC